MAAVLIRSSVTDEEYVIDDAKIAVAGLVADVSGTIMSFADASFAIMWYHPSGSAYP